MANLSVIIPAHNEEKTICKTVKSLFQQSYRLFEIVVVDDGSTDETATKLVREFNLSQMELKQIHGSLNHKGIVQILSTAYQGIPLYLLVKENGGKGDALNAGIDFSHGTFVVCIDADCVVTACTLGRFADTLQKEHNITAIGGRVFPLSDILHLNRKDRFSTEKYLLKYQELEYGIAFSIARPFFDRIGTTMLISGALGLFRKETVIELGGYSLDTVGEDMELVMRIRQRAAKQKCLARIAYDKEASCYTELPWNIIDWVKQRIRWTVGLSEVLWKYRSVLTDKEYSVAEKITFLYYLLLERYIAHIEMASMIACFLCGFSECALALITITIMLQFLLAIVGSYQSILDSIKSSNHRMRTLMEWMFIMISFLSVYHLAHSLIRLISVPYYRIKKHVLKSKSVVWQSPVRM